MALRLLFFDQEIENNMMIHAANSFMAFDYGSRWIGVAVGSRFSQQPEVLQPIMVRRKKADWASLQALQHTWQPDAFVVGLAYHADDQLSSTGKKAQDFGAFLQRKFNKPCYYVDEYLSSWQAAQNLILQAGRGRRSKSNKHGVHGHSAAVILHTFLSEPATTHMAATRPEETGK